MTTTSDTVSEINQMKLCRKVIVGGNHRILIISDLHLKSVNPKNRKDYPLEVLNYIKHLLTIIELENVDIVIFLGDIYNDEFTGKQSDNLNQKFLGMIHALKYKGVRVFTLMGNHEKHKFDKECPFFKNIDYDSQRIMRDLKALHLKLPEFPMHTFETCDELVVGDSLCIHMHHFSDIDKTYLSPKTEFPVNLGLFHDAILPSKARQHIKAITEVDLSKYTKVEYNDEMYANLNYAVCGDIHTRIGEMVVTTSTGDCLTDIPGTIGRNDSSIAQSHESLELPIFTIDNNVVTKSHIHFKLLPYKESFKLSVIEENKQNYTDLKDFKSNIEGVAVRHSFLNDIEQFPNYIQNVVNEIVETGTYQLKSKDGVMRFIQKGKQAL